MDDLLDRMREEEAELKRKLEAVRQFLAAYGGDAPGGARRNKAAHAGPPKPRSLAERMDKFGPYGERVVTTAMRFLPTSNGAPVRTRELVDSIEGAGVAITGDNKVNALSALLARSSRIKGYGRAGWTLADNVTVLNENGEAEASPDAEEVRDSSNKSREDFQSLPG